VRLEGLGQLKIPVNSQEIEPINFRFIPLVPQPTMPPRAPYIKKSEKKVKHNLKITAI
jgi:hypothetical protein